MFKFTCLTVSALALSLNFAVAAEAPLDYPHTKTVDQIDNYFGAKVADPYRWLEDDNAPDTKAWVQQQDQLTFSYLDRIAYRPALLARVKALANFARYSVPIQRNGDLYYLKNDGLQNQSVMMVDKGGQGHPEVLLDPNTFSADNTISMKAFQISRDGHYAVWCQTAIAGSDWDDIHIMDLTTRKPLEVLHWNRYSEDAAFQGDGFYYMRLPVPEPGTELTAPTLNVKLYFHKIGEDQSADQLAYQDTAHPTFYPAIATTEDERFTVLTVEDPSKLGNSLAVKDAAHPAAGFRSIAEIGDDSYDLIDNDGDDMIIRTNHHAPNGTVVRYRLDHASGSPWQTLIAERHEPIDQVSYAGDRLFVTYLKDVVDHTMVFTRDGHAQGEVQLPGSGAMEGGFAGRHEDADTYYAYTSFTYPTTVFRYDLKSASSTVFAQPVIPGYQAGNYVSREVFFKSRDGTRIPMFLTYRKGLERNGSNPTMLYGYGGFRVTINPGFDASNIAWMEQGGIYASVNLRGGGEYGEKWHEAGMRLKKQNVFDDCAAAAKYLIAQKYTSAARLVLAGDSNGGLLVGAVINQHPELFGVGLAGVGVMDMLRFQHFSAGTGWVSDYGSSDDRAGFLNLIKFSPLHNIKSGVDYPAMLVLTADHDDRVVPAHSFKYIATLQAKDTGARPHLIRIDTNSGHGSSNLDKVLQEVTDKDAFAWTNIGVTPVYPVP